MKMLFSQTFLFERDKHRKGERKKKTAELAFKDLRKFLIG
jgi:hypothetical protein